MSRRNDTPEFTDPAIKLFGRSISFSESHAPLPENVDFRPPQFAPPSTSDSPEASPRAIKIQEEPCLIEDSDNEDETPTSEDPGTESPGQENSEAVDKNSEENKADAFKKPDKILPCPRCNSMDTKFCYFNNYNVNQPRHFCRSCQRYWTAGGAIRNVPIGAGRRKSKHNSSPLQPVVVPITSSETGDVLRVNPDSPLYRSVANKLSLKDPENIVVGARAGFPSPTCSSMRENEVSPIEMVGPPPPLQGFPGPPPPYPWNFGWNGMGIPPSSAFLVPWNPPTMICMPNISFPPFMSPMPWGWDAPPSYTGNTSPLGKHSRDINSENEEKNEKSLWIPKTLRIDDPEAAAKSSIWSTLGIKPGKNEPFSKGGMFKAFQSTTEGNEEISESNKALEANPAALSRSKAFQERT